METSRPQRLAAVASVLAVGCLSLLGLSSFGIWDPWEVEIAEPARRAASGEAVAIDQIGPWLVSQSFRVFGVHEWSGRLPVALSGVLALCLGYALVARFAERRTALYAVLILGSTPLFLCNTRTMLGEAPSIALATAIGWSACHAVLGRGEGKSRIAWLALCAALAGLGTFARGALLCAWPPLAAVAVTAGLEGTSVQASDRQRGSARLLLWLLVLALSLAIARAVRLDDPSFNRWLGGAAQGGQPPSFDAVIERVFHAFAPFSALLPLAFGRIAQAPAENDEQSAGERSLLVVALLWSGFSYGALTLYLSRYGHKAAVYPVPALSAAVALYLRDVERSRVSQWPAALAVTLLALLILRDYALYPIGPVHGMPVAEFTVPEVFNPAPAWSAVLGLFIAAAVLTLGGYRPVQEPLALGAPYLWLKQQWRRGIGEKLWLLGGAALLLGLDVFGALCFVPKVAAQLATLTTKVGKGLMLVPPALAAAVALIQLALHLASKLGAQRSVPLLLAGLCTGVYTAFGFMPALSAHFSPREVYETYNELAKAGETLAEYKVGARAAAYYAKGPAAEVDSLNQLLDRLVSEKRAWAIFPSDELPAIDRMFRARKQRHLFVADARNERAVLASNLPFPGRKDQNTLAEHVKREAPSSIQHPLAINFDDKLLLLGYDLKLPHRDHVGAGERFRMIWYFKALKPIGNYRMFLHIDADANRIHGDHDPVDGKYPTRLWDPGDVIIDEQELEVPASYPGGDYTIFMGFYAGETRLPVKAGPKDDGNRAIAGVLRIR